MKLVLFSCFDRMRWNPEKNKGHEKFLKFIANASMDPLRESKRLRIISQIDRGIDMDILEMDDFSPQRGLGSGAFSEVWLLMRKRDRRKFAGKFLTGEIGTSEFINEASIMKSCSTDCPSIVNLVGIITTPKCLVLDYYVNGSLDLAFLEDNINREQGHETEFPFLRRLGYILDICQAVEVLHRRNICHRDLALRNLLLSNDKEHVLLSDFSLSRTANSAIERQFTSTAIVPENSAPETFKKSTTSTPGSKRRERFYSMKSDVWSLGIVMFEIINMESIHVDRTQSLPSGFSPKRLPPNNIFNRIEELWIEIVRCWDEKPERRPQSWEVHERIEMLSQNPLAIGNEYEGYETHFSDKASPKVEYHYKDPNWQSCSLFPKVCTDYTPVSGVSGDEIYLSDSFMPESPMSSTLAEPENPDGINHLIIQDMIDRFTKVHKLSIQVNGDKSSNNKQKRVKLNMSGFKNFRNGHLSLPSGTSSPNKNTFCPSVNLINQSCANYSVRKMFDQSNADYQGIPGRRDIDLISHSSLGSCISLYTPSVTSLEQASVLSERVQYCPPLSASFTSSVTNIKYCRDRQFFPDAAQNLTPEEKAKNILTPDSEAGEQIPATCQTSTIEGETIRFLIEIQ